VTPELAAAEFAAVIVNYNAGPEIRAALQSIAGEMAKFDSVTEPRAGGGWEALVVDNASTDGSSDYVWEFAPRARVLRNAGTPDAEIDDEVQRTFITAARRLDDVRPGAEKGFLFKIALNLAAHARRTLARRREVLAEEAPERNETFPTPEQLTDQKRMRQLLDGVLDRMDESLRVVFVLYEFEEMNMSEIADVLEIPRGTVASRLRRARAEFRERVAAIEGVVPGKREDERKP